MYKWTKKLNRNEKFNRRLKQKENKIRREWDADQRKCSHFVCKHFFAGDKPWVHAAASEVGEMGRGMKSRWHKEEEEKMEMNVKKRREETIMSDWNGWVTDCRYLDSKCKRQGDNQRKRLVDLIKEKSVLRKREIGARKKDRK